MPIHIINSHGCIEDKLIELPKNLIFVTINNLTHCGNIGLNYDTSFFTRENIEKALESVEHRKKFETEFRNHLLVKYSPHMTEEDVKNISINIYVEKAPETVCGFANHHYFDDSKKIIEYSVDSIGFIHLWYGGVYTIDDNPKYNKVCFDQNLY